LSVHPVAQRLREAEAQHLDLVKISDENMFWFYRDAIRGVARGENVTNILDSVRERKKVGWLIKKYGLSSILDKIEEMERWGTFMWDKFAYVV